MESDGALELATGGVKRSLGEVPGVGGRNGEKSEGNAMQSNKDPCLLVVRLRWSKNRVEPRNTAELKLADPRWPDESSIGSHASSNQVGR
jgi:hypothetical protein